MPKHQRFNAAAHVGEHREVPVIASDSIDKHMRIRIPKFIDNQLGTIYIGSVYITKQQAMEFFGLVDSDALDHSKKQVVDELEFINRPISTSVTTFDVLYENFQGNIRHERMVMTYQQVRDKLKAASNVMYVISITERDPRLDK